MPKTNAGGWKPLGAGLVFCQLLFVLPAVFPGVLLCHRSNGRAVLEMATPFGCCCEECEHCLERRLHPEAERSSRPAFAPCHCQHERAISEPDASSEFVSRRGTVAPPALYAAAAALPRLTGPPADASSIFLSAPGFLPGGAGLSPLRC